MAYCPRCSGRKKVFKVRGAYSLVDSGGVEVDCPYCGGTGQEPDFEQEVAKLEQKKQESSKTSNKSSKKPAKEKAVPKKRTRKKTRENSQL